MSTQVPVPLPAAAEAALVNQFIAEFTLPFSGKPAQIRRGKGRDLRLGLMAAGPKADQYQILMALLSQITLIDGKHVAFEEFDDMDLVDVMELQNRGKEVLLPLVQQAQQLRLEKKEPASSESSPAPSSEPSSLTASPQAK